MTADVSADRDELFAAGAPAARDPEAIHVRIQAALALLDAVDSCLPGAPAAATVETLVVAARPARLPDPGGA